MNSLKLIHIFQNGIKEEGMSELLKSLENKCNLEHLKLNDNLIKDSSPILIEILPTLSNLRVLDISDSLLGHAHSLNLFKSLSSVENLREIYCNYNEIEKKSIQKLIFEICLTMNNLSVVELKGNDIDPSLWKKFKKDLQKNIMKFEPYSDEEEVMVEEEEDLEEVSETLNNLIIK